MNKKKLIVLTIVFLIGAFLRFFALGDVPVGFHKDEAFLGYNAYSILNTGRDINGNVLPMHLESFLYSPAGYSYASIPFISLFGLSAFSIRFASAFFGSLTILLSFFLAQHLWYRSTYRYQLGILSAFLLAIYPWHINLSRTATENTLVVFFITLGTLLFLRWTNGGNHIVLISAFVSFFASLLTYQAPRAFLPFFIPLLIFSFWDMQTVERSKVYVGILFICLVILPLGVILSSKDLSVRINTVSVLAGEGTQLKLDEHIREDGVANIPPWEARIFHNKVIGYAQQISINYFEHFSYNFLFTDSGFPKRYRVPEQGLLYYFSLPFLLLGVWMLIKEQKRSALFLIGWVLLAPIGSALTFDDVPNLQRTLIIFPALSMICAYGALTIFLMTKKYFFAKSLIALFVIFSIFCVTYYLHQYYIHSTRHQTFYRSEGYKDLVVQVNALLPAYKKAIITDRESSPAIFFLFYSTYSPHLFQQKTRDTSMRDFDRVNFAQYEFSQEECPLKVIQVSDGTKVTTGQRGVLYVNSGLCKDEKNIKVLSSIKRPDNSTAFKIVVLE